MWECEWEFEGECKREFGRTCERESKSMSIGLDGLINATEFGKKDGFLYMLKQLDKAQLD